MMKKIFTTIFIALLFCTTIFAEDFVVTSVKGTVRYESSKRDWTLLKVDDKLTGESVIDVRLNSEVKLKGKDGKNYRIKSLKIGTVASLIIPDENKPNTNDNMDENIHKVRISSISDSPELIARMTKHEDEHYSEIISNLGFGSIKNLLGNKNVVRLCSTLWNGHEIIELAWDKSSASIIYIRGDENGKKINIKTEQTVINENVENIANLIKKTDFYNQPGYVHVNGRDGETWYVEVNIDGKYKSVSRWDPRETFLKDLGEALIRLAR